jgi:hypothetical protein
MHVEQNKQKNIEKSYFNIMPTVTHQKTSPIQIRER